MSKQKIKQAEPPAEPMEAAAEPAPAPEPAPPAAVAPALADLRMPLSELARRGLIGSYRPFGQLGKRWENVKLPHVLLVALRRIVRFAELGALAEAALGRLISDALQAYFAANGLFSPEDTATLHDELARRGFPDKVTFKLEEPGIAKSIAGLTMRDYFAAAALTGWLGNAAAMNELADEIQKARIAEERQAKTMNRVLARRSYMLADAMLKAREKQPEPV